MPRGFRSGEYQGVPLDPLEKLQVLEAITLMKNVGILTNNKKWTKMSDLLLKHLNKGRICKDGGAGFAGPGAPDWGTLGVTSVRRGKRDPINIMPRALASDPGILAGVLAHEFTHVCEPVGLVHVDPNGNPSRAHCHAYFVEYCFLQDALASGILTPPQVAAARQRSKEIVEGLGYPDFPDWKIAGKTGLPGGSFSTIGITTPGATSGTEVTFGLFVTQSEFWSNLNDGTTDPPTGVTISTGFETHVLRAYRAPDGRLVALASGKSGNAGVLRVYWDADSDDLVDESTEITIVSATDGLGPVTGLTWTGAGETAEFFIIDSGSSTIYRLDDTDEDGIPDQLGDEFASPAEFPELAGALSLDLAEPESLNQQVTASFREHRLNVCGFEFDNAYTVVRLRDTDSDGVADWSSGPVKFGDDIMFAPVFVDGVFKQKNQLMVDGPRGTTVQVWAYQASTDDFTELLGSGVTNEDEVATISLNRSLGQNDVVRARNATLDLVGEEAEVTNPEPLVH